MSWTPTTWGEPPTTWGTPPPAFSGMAGATCAAEEVEWITPDGTVYPLDEDQGVCPGRPFGRFLPPTLRQEQARPEGPGTVVIRLGHGSRLVRVPAAFAAADAADLRTLLRQWSQRLNVLDGEGWLRYTSPDDSTDVRTLRCAYNAGLELDETRGSQQLGVMLTDLEFVAADPYWTDYTTVEVPIGAGDRPAFLPIPNQTTGSFVTITSGTAWAEADVANSGDLPAFPVWTIGGPADGVVRITDRDSGEFIELDGVRLAEGEELVIDVEAGAVTIEGENAWPLVTDPSRMWLLQAGTAHVGVDVENSGPATYVTLRFRRRWLSV